MLNYAVHGQLAGELLAPVSKSDLHRLILACALSDGSSLIRRCTLSEDIRATARVMEAAGAAVTFGDDNILVEGIGQHKSERIDCDCGESGSTLRFLVPVMAALGQSARFIGHGRLAQRPMQPLLQQLEQHGVTFSLPDNGDWLPMELDGKLQGGCFSFSGDISSQYITGLLFALPLLHEDSQIRLTSPLQSKGYVVMTLRVLERFDITIHPVENGWDIPGNQQYRTPGQLEAQGDWSNAAFWLCAGAIGNHPLTVHGLDLQSLQGDRAVADLLAQMGAQVTTEGHSVTVTPAPLKAITIDGAQIPDIIPVLSVVAAVAQGETHIVNAGRLRIKESDRLHAMYQCLSAIGADITELADGLIIRGKPQLRGGTVDSFNDHRIAMSMAVASLVCKEPVVIRDPLCVSKSYPHFYKDFQALGGDVHVIDLGA